MVIIRKFLGLGLAAFIGLSATGAKVDPAYCNQNDIIGDTPIITNAEEWVSNLLGNGKYDPNTDEGRTELARDIIKAFGAEDTSVRGRLAFKLAGVSPDKTVTVSGITANGNFTIDWGDGTREVVENPPLLAGAMPRTAKSISHRYPEGIPTPTIDFPEGQIIEITGTGDGESSTDQSFIRDEDGNGLISAVNVSEYDDPITWGVAAFAGNPVQELDIPKNVTVGFGCFATCTKLKKLKLDSTRVSSGAFRACTRLGDVTIGKHCQSIGARCFDTCLALSNVVFESGSSLKVIDSEVFRGCGNLKKLELPDGLESFGLGSGTGITDLKLPDSIKMLGNLSMADCWLRETFKLPASIESLHTTFKGWTNLQYVTIPRSCKNIYCDTFNNCRYLTNVNFETGCRIAQIQGYLGGNPESMGAFYMCKSLKSIRIPLGAGFIFTGQVHPNASIGSRTFEGCDVLEEVTLDCAFQNKYMTIGSTIFKDCPLIRKVSFTSEYAPVSAGDYAFLDPLPDGFKISIPNGSSCNYKSQTGWSNYAGYFEERPLESFKVVVRCNSSQTINETIKLGPTYCEDTFIVDWGDGNIDEYESGASPSHTYVFPDYNGRSGDKPKQIVVKVKGMIKRIEGCKDGSGNVAHTYLADGANNNADKTISYVYVDADDTNIRIGDYCFKGCSLAEFTPGQYVTKIGNNCFQNSTSLANVEFNARGWLDSIGDYSFAGCTKLTSVSLPKLLYDIGDYSFAGCTNLTSISLPKSLYDIGDRAFYGDTLIESVDFSRDGNLENIGAYAFTSYDQMHYRQLGCKLTSLEIPRSVKTIGEGAFNGAQVLTNFSIPRDSLLESIGPKAFFGMILVEDGIYIPKYVRSIGDWAFGYAEKSPSIEFGEGSHLETIGENAFANCYKVKSIVIPKSVKTIKNLAFNSCSELTNITFESGSKLEHIGFLGDQVKLGRVEFPSTLKYFGGYYSWTVDGETYTPTLPEGVEYIGSLGVNDHPTATEYTLPQSAKYLHNTLNGWSSLESITVPAGVTNMYSAFSWCSELKNVTFENGCPGLKEIGRGSFRYCKKLQSIVIPDNVEVVGYEAFSGCDELASVTLPANLKETGLNAFWLCPKITAITIPDGMVKIGVSTFARTSLTEVSIPASVTEIDEDAFAYIETLTTVRIYSATPPTCKNAYGSTSTTPLGATIPSNCRIYVPSASMSTYMNDSVWGTYRNNIYGM